MSLTCPSCDVTVGLGHGPCTEHTPANPWAGRHACPSCGSAEWTLPVDVPGLGPWRCTACSLAFGAEAERGAA